MEPTLDQRLDPRVVTLWRLQRLVRLAMFNVPVAVAIGVGISSVSSRWLGAAVALLLVLTQAALALAWPTLSWRAFRYSVRDDDLLVQSGVLFRRWSAIPFTRIQNVDTRQGPFERLMGLARLQVYTAAGMSADGSIPGLSQARAEQLRDQLSRRGGDDGDDGV